uniref:Uncharacterized protein n=1 Tax=Tetranychus urticae TaxID=32264 RepID=T1JXH0_TETUR
MEKKTILMNSIRIFCIVIFTFQFYLLTRNYLRFDVRKEVTNYISNEIEIPEVRFLIPYQFAFDLNFLRTKYNASFDSICRKLSTKGDCDGHLTNPILFSKSFGHLLLLSDITQHSYPVERFINKIYWSESSEDPLETGKCKVTKKASASYLLIVLRCLDSSGLPLKLSRSKAVVFNSNYLLDFSLNATVMLMKLIYPGKALVEDSSLHTYAIINKGKQTSCGVRFTKHTENLLPPPHKTSCKNYDRRQVFEDCLNNNSLNRTGLLSFATAVPLDKHTELHFNSPYLNQNSSALEIYEDCLALVTQPMCNSVRYSFQMSVNLQDTASGNEQINIRFLATSEFDSITEYKPDFPLFDYLILSGSLFATWFGISIMGQLLSASRLLCLTFDQRRAVGVENPSNEPVTPASTLSMMSCPDRDET